MDSVVGPRRRQRIETDDQRVQAFLQARRAASNPWASVLGRALQPVDAPSQVLRSMDVSHL